MNGEERTLPGPPDEHSIRNHFETKTGGETGNEEFADIWAPGISDRDCANNCTGKRIHTRCIAHGFNCTRRLRHRQKARGKLGSKP